MRLPSKIVFFFSALIFLSILSAVTLQAADKRDIMRGEVFTEPSRKMLMPDEWIKKPVKYAKDGEGADLYIVMDQDIYYTLLPIIQRFGKEKKIKIIVKEGTCGIASGMLGNKLIDMGGFCCPPGKEDRLPGLRFHTMGIVAKAFFVHPENPVENVSTEELRYIYRGKIHRWSNLKTQSGKPGPDWHIRTVGRLHCLKRPGHWRQLLDSDKEFGPRLFEVGSIPDMIAQVAVSKDAIGWEVLTMVEKNKNMGKVKPIKINGYSPKDSKGLSSLKYPFYRTYSLTTWEGKGIENKNATALVNYMIKEFEKLDHDRYGFVPVSRLKKAGWKFDGDELVGEPDQ